MDQNKLN